MMTEEAGRRQGIPTLRNFVSGHQEILKPQVETNSIFQNEPGFVKLKIS